MGDMIDRDAVIARLLAYGTASTEKAAEAIAALPAVTVGVKPLVWRDLHKDGCTFVPREGFNAFDFSATINMLNSDNWRYAGSCFPTLEAAKAAAQADYEAHILAALEPMTPPAPDAAAIREAWERAYWRLRSYTVHDNDCKLNKPPRFDGPCSCGLTAALEEAAALITEKPHDRA